MKAILTFAILFFTSTSFAQKIRFTDHRNTWISRGQAAEGCPFTLTLTYGVDTIIAGKTYQQLVSSVVNEISAGCYPYYGGTHYLIREDTVAGILYYRNYSDDTVKHIYFNYNLHTGDTIDFNPFYLTPRDSVVRIDSTLINGVYHKVFYMASRESYPCYFTFVEGIGSMGSPFIPFSTGCFEFQQSLVCFSQNVLSPPMPIDFPISEWQSTDSFHNCSTLSTGTLTKPSTEILIAPNPARGQIDITASKQFNNGTSVVIYDMTGRCVYNAAIGLKDNISINTSLWNSGLYLVTIQDKTGIISREKVTLLK